MTDPGTAPLATGAETVSLTADDAGRIKMALYSHCGVLDRAAFDPEFAHGADTLQASAKRAAQLADQFLHLELAGDHVIVPATAVIGEEAKQAWARILEAVGDLLDTGADGYDMDRLAIEVTTWTVTNLREARLTLTALLGRTGEGVGGE